MPWYTLAYTSWAVSDLARIDKQMAQRLLDKTKWLASNAGNLPHAPVTSDLPGISKYAVGDWRILYSIDPVEQLVHIRMIGHRNDLYRKTSESRPG
jgi:mRNA interferase RelE/StbE